uniref:Uncharacterized protein n=1 Tax=viral metagenome TaxID=1070528 RepID=A0A6M3XYZ0_9ZZZZ
MGTNIYIRSKLQSRIIKLGHDEDDIADYVNQKLEEAVSREEAGGTQG